MVILGNCSYYDLQSAYQQTTMGKTHVISETPKSRQNSGSISFEYAPGRFYSEEVQFNGECSQGHEGQMGHRKP